MHPADRLNYPISHNPTITAALRKRGFFLAHTGGGCTAYVRGRWDEDGPHELFTCDDGVGGPPTADIPLMWTEPCSLGRYTTSMEPGTEQHWPTVREALFGPAALSMTFIQGG